MSTPLNRPRLIRRFVEPRKIQTSEVRRPELQPRARACALPKSEFRAVPQNAVSSVVGLVGVGVASGVVADSGEFSQSPEVTTADGSF